MLQVYQKADSGESINGRQLYEISGETIIKIAKTKQHLQPGCGLVAQDYYPYKRIFFITIGLHCFKINYDIIMHDNFNIYIQLQRLNSI